MAQHIDVTSQIVRHQMLMDLAKAVKEQGDKYGQEEPPGDAYYEDYPIPVVHKSGK